MTTLESRVEPPPPCSSVPRPLLRTAERLMAECADDLAPGQVLAAVVRLDRALWGIPWLDQESRAATCESALRIALATRAG